LSWESIDHPQARARHAFAHGPLHLIRWIEIRRVDEEEVMVVGYGGAAVVAEQLLIVAARLIAGSAGQHMWKARAVGGDAKERP